jgi:hypothetical protein
VFDIARHNTPDDAQPNAKRRRSKVLFFLSLTTAQEHEGLDYYFGRRVI